MRTDTDGEDNPVYILLQYIRISILHPNEFIVEGFPENLMPAIYSEIFSEEEVNDLIAYLLTLQ